MKRHITTTLLLGLLGMISMGQIHAASNKLEKEMEDYAKDFYRAHPDEAGEMKRREAAAKMVADAKQHKITELTKADKKKLRKRDGLVTDGAFKTALEQMKSLNSNKPKVTFLIKYAEQEKIKPIEKLLAYRLLKHDFEEAARAAGEEREKRLRTVLKKYLDYKSANGKPAPSLDALNLPEEAKQFTNSKGEKIDWIYIGHLGPVLKVNDTHIILAEPEPMGNNRICAMDNGSVSPFKDSGIKDHLDKLKNRKAGTPPTSNNPDTKEEGQPNPTANIDHPAAPALQGLMKKYMAHKKANENQSPDTLDKLDLTEEEKNYTNAAGDKSAWIYWGNKSKLRVSEDVFIAVVAPKADGDKRIVGLSDGRITFIKDEQIAPHIK